MKTIIKHMNELEVVPLYVYLDVLMFIKTNLRFFHSYHSFRPHLHGHHCFSILPSSSLIFYTSQSLIHNGGAPHATDCSMTHIYCLSVFQCVCLCVQLSVRLILQKIIRHVGVFFVKLLHFCVVYISV